MTQFGFEFALDSNLRPLCNFPLGSFLQIKNESMKPERKPRHIKTNKKNPPSFESKSNFQLFVLLKVASKSLQPSENFYLAVLNSSEGPNAPKSC